MRMVGNGITLCPLSLTSMNVTEAAVGALLALKAVLISERPIEGLRTCPRSLQSNIIALLT